jgi:hypothetical protein
VSRAGLWAAACLVGVSTLAGPRAVEAQARPAGAQQTPTAEQQQDSTRQQILERLRRLGRAPGADSALYVQDSVRLAEAAGAIRPGGGAGAGLDSIAAALTAMPGYSLTEYRGTSADFRAEARVLELRGDSVARARVVRGAMQFEADSSITFDQATGRVQHTGAATFAPPTGDPVESPSMVYDLNQGRGSALDAQTSYMQQGARWLVRGDMPFAAMDSSFMSHARFTSCDLTEPHSHFETDQIKIVGGNMLVARSVRLVFGDVPVFWLPFVAQSLSSGRASGLLTPRFSVNDIVRTSGGYRRRVSNLGFYWAMSDYSDALFAMDWFSQTFFSVTGSTTYLFNRQFLQGNANVRRYWREGGSTELSFDSQHSWQPDERTDIRASGRYASSNAFVRENSFNPREVTQSIDSEGGISRRFDWGALSISANRQQYLSDDRTEWTLPSANLSLAPVTLFRAAPTEGRFWNNMTWAGSSNVRRNTVDRLRLPTDTFRIALASTVRSGGGLSSNLSMGRLTLSQSVDFSQDETLRVPDALLLLGDSANPADLLTGAPARDIAQASIGWSAAVNYQQQLIGSTTLTPRLSVSGNMFRADTSTFAQNFVSAPSRVAFGAQLKTDIYGFYPGFGSFETVRHKLSPSFDYQWSPKTSPSDLQRQVFASRALRPQNQVAVTLNQTWEAKRRSDLPQPGADSTSADSIAAPLVPIPAGGGATQAQTGPRRVQQAQIVSLLALRTSVVRYDFVQADSAGRFLQGFETTRLSNQISSDILRGLSVSMDHELWADAKDSVGTLVDRRFAPHLAQVNLSFSLGSSSALFRWLGLSRAGADEGPTPPPEGQIGLPGIGGATDESSVVPNAADPRRAPTAAPSGSVGGWNANFSYSLQRPRDGSRPASQMITSSFQLQPTEAWALTWQTAYDLERQAFNDHSIRLTRDLHEWQANFDFLQTATGNWSFRFEVALLANRDLKFDYDQQNLDLGIPAESR